MTTHGSRSPLFRRQRGDGKLGVREKDDSGCATTSQRPQEQRQPQPQLGPRMNRVAATVLLLLLILAWCAGLVRKMETTISLTDLSDTINLPPKHHKGDEQTSDDTIHEMNGVISLEANGTVYKVTKQAAQQIMNYRQGTGLILNIHITHHGGTTICRTIGRSPDADGGTPDFACMSEKDTETKTNYSYTPYRPWRRNETSIMIATARKHYHMISWEYGNVGQVPHPSLLVTEWENPNLFSILVVRDPISRLLARTGGWLRMNLPDINRGNASKEDWWTYAKHPWLTNNYALRVLGRPGECCDGAKTNPKYLENAKALVRRFSVVLDVECLSQGIEAVASLLNITVADPGGLRRKSNPRAPSRQRIGRDDVYEYLVEKNRLDIELYEWSKNRALISCTNAHESSP